MNDVDNILDVLAEAEDIFGAISPEMRFEAGRVHDMSSSGQWHTNKAGSGFDMIGPAEFHPEKHDRRHIDHKLSLKHKKRIVMEREVEASKRHILWVDTSPSQDFKSEDARFSKKESGIITAVMMAFLMARQQDAVGVVDEGKLYRGARYAVVNVGQVLTNVTITGGANAPEVPRFLRTGDTMTLISDFAPTEDDDAALIEALDEMSERGIEASLVMKLDPAEIEFNYKGAIEFAGTEGEVWPSGKLSEDFEKAEDLRKLYIEALRERIERIQVLCAERDFTFVFHATDEPFEEVIEYVNEGGQENPLQYVPEVSR
ncbi:MAG: DUF58 domain-containing protein [Alphaproteobacteria bacterium]|nr:DUF58 domain-containing protein [Alphaproteobacteria bacterium]MCD8571618.1 DUF58 domain-containing protein [Alphaproteobacteria bacterium]